MARIRSVHPGFFTDERLVCVSMSARMLFIGLGVEADDKGIFEWKPLTLKMRIFPADNLDVSTLLAELEEADAIAAYEIDGRRYGAIRNFRKFQKPKTPNDIHPMPDDFRNYVGLNDPVSEAFPQKGEKHPQMEDGGGNSSSEPSGSDAPPAVDARQLLWSEGLSILVTISGKPNSGARQLLGKWLKASRDDCALVMSKILAARDNRVGEPVSWITAALSPPSQSPPRAGVVGMAHRIIESENNGSEGIFGDNRHVELLPAASGDGQRNPPQNLLGSPPRREFAGRH